MKKNEAVAVIERKLPARTKEQDALKEHVGKIVASMPSVGAEMAAIWNDSFEYNDKNEMIGMMVHAAWTAYWKAFKELMEVDGAHKKRCDDQEKKIASLLKEAYAINEPKAMEFKMQEWRDASKDYDRDKARMEREHDRILTTWKMASDVAAKLANEYRQTRTSSGYYTKTSELEKYLALINMVLQSKLSGHMDLLKEVQKALYEQQKQIFPITINQEAAE